MCVRPSDPVSGGELPHVKGGLLVLSSEFCWFLDNFSVDELKLLLKRGQRALIWSVSWAIYTFAAFVVLSAVLIWLGGTTVKVIAVMLGMYVHTPPPPPPPPPHRTPTARSHCFLLLLPSPPLARIISSLRTILSSLCLSPCLSILSLSALSLSLSRVFFPVQSSLSPMFALFFTRAHWE